MSKIALLSILILFVYQFDDVVRAAHLILSRWQRKEYKRLVLDSDKYVGAALTIITLPLILNYILISNKSLTVSLITMALALLCFSLLASGLRIFMKRLEFVPQRENINAIAGLVYAVAGMFKPGIRMIPWVTGEERARFAKMAFMLSLPVLLGLAFKWYYGSEFFANFSKYVDTLIVVMIGGLFIQITIVSLEKYFRAVRLNVLSLFRVALGAGIIFLFIYRASMA